MDLKYDVMLWTEFISFRLATQSGCMLTRISENAEKYLEKLSN
jgi:hypothetical protein